MGSRTAVARIGFLTDNIISLGNYQTQIWKGATEAARGKGVEFACLCGGTLEMSPINPFEKHRNAVYALVNPRHFDGFVVMSTVGSFIGLDRFKSFLESLSPTPTVLVGRPMEDYPCVVEQNYSGMKRLVSHLIRDHGKKRIAFLQGPATMKEIDDRYRAYRDALGENGIGFEPELVHAGDLMPESGERAVEIFIDERRARPDALVAANDNMALGALAELMRRGIPVPGRIAVGGYDDIEEASVSTPSLATVRSPIMRMGREAVKLLIKILDGKSAPRRVTLASEAVFRESCGCPRVKPVTDRPRVGHRLTGTAGLKTSRKDIIGSVVKQLGASPPPLLGKRLGALFDAFIKDLEAGNGSDRISFQMSKALDGSILSDDMISSLHGSVSAFREITRGFFRKKSELDAAAALWDSTLLLIASHAYRLPRSRMIERDKKSETIRSVERNIIALYDMRGLSDVLVDQLPRLGIRRFFLFLNKDTAAGRRVGGMVSAKLVAAVEYCDGAGLDPAAMRKDIDREGFFRELFRSCARHKKGISLLLVESLHFRDENFGFVVYESDPGQNVVFETLTGQISSVIMDGILFRERLNAEKRLTATLSKLEKTNRKLRSVSIIDELTGLYNRRGFFMLAEQQINQSMRMGMNFLLFFGDMDGLKLINDNNGHSEGDRAIRDITRLLRASFRKSDIISRIGGDEFVIIAPDTPRGTADMILEKLAESLAMNNENENRPYRLDISFGISEFDGGRPVDLESLLAEADKLLYLKKEMKKTGGSS